jgi:CubicO group peptidase (beta-lactamase class C family)
MYGSHDDEALERNVSSWKDDVFFTEPGKIYSYSNLGFVLAGRLIEVVNGKPFADSMEELVFKPLDMKSTTFLPTTAMTYPLAVGHTTAGAVSRPAADHAGYWPAGSMFTSGNDFAKFAIAFMNGDVPQALAKPNVDVPGLRAGVKYGYGLQIDTSTGIVEHGGSRTGYRSHLTMAPQFKTGVVVLCNKDGALPGPIAKKALDLLLPAKFPDSPPSKPITTDLTKLPGKYVNGPNTIEVTLEAGKLTVAKHPLEPASATCFRNTTTTACFVNGYLHAGGRSYARAN